jgi:RNA polymerase sigma-70 factor (ECF subfamily)
MTGSLDDLLPEVRRLDEAALTRVYQDLSPRLYQYAYRLLGNAQEAEEVTADAFHRLLLVLRAGGGPRHHLAAYLYRVAHNLVTDRFRRQPPPDLQLDDRLFAGAAFQPPETAAQHLAQAQARAALARLTPDQRLVITLRYFECLSNEETAAALGKPVGAIKALQHRALASLRRVLRPALMEVTDEQMA